MLIDTDDMGSARPGQARGTGRCDRPSFARSGKKVIARGSLFPARASTTWPRRPMRCISIPSASCCSTATSATGCSTRMRSTSSASTCICSAPASSRVPRNPSRAVTCRPRTARRATAYLQALWSGYRNAVASARSLKRRGDRRTTPTAMSAAVAAAGGDTGQGGQGQRAGHGPARPQRRSRAA